MEKTMYFQSIEAPEDPEVRALYDKIVEGGWSGAKENLPMNMFTYLGDRPDLLEWYWKAAQQTLAGGKLPVTLKQMIGLALASRSGSEYCSHAHYKALEMLGVPEDVIHRCSTGEGMENLPPVQRKVIEFAAKVADNSTKISEDDVKELQNIGLSKEEIVELILFIGLAHTMMIWTNVAHIPKDG